MASSSRGASQQHLLIKSLIPQSGDACEVGTITALVGPHNSGTTETLRDILRLAANLELDDVRQPAAEAPHPVVLRDLALVGQLTVDRLITGLTRVPGDSEGDMVQGIGPDLATPLRRLLAADIKNILYRPMMNARAIASTALGELMPLRMAYLDAGGRAASVASAAACSPDQAADSLLQLLHDAPQSVHDKLDQAFSAAFEGLHIRLDDTQRVRLQLRVAERFPPRGEDPLAAVRQYADLRQLDQQGEGLQGFAAVVLTMLLSPGRVVLLDQPAAALQREQARRLGAWISDHAADLDCQVFLTSQDVSFLGGLFEGIADVRLLRLERRQDTTRLNPISPDVGTALARHPLLSSQSSLESLFCEGIVLVPRDTDRMVYETVARSMRAVNNLRFLHSHGVANLKDVAQALRRTGVPLCVVAELDVFSDESSFAKLVRALTGDDPPQPWMATRERLASHIEGWFDERSLSSSAHEVENFLDQLKAGDDQGSSGPVLAVVDGRQQKWERLKRERLEVLPPELRTWVEQLLEELRHIGIFVSPQGNTQTWMSEMLSFDKKKSWLLQTLEAIRNQRCPADLQAFVADIVSHLGALRLPSRATRTPERT